MNNDPDVSKSENEKDWSNPLFVQILIIEIISGSIFTYFFTGGLSWIHQNWTVAMYNLTDAIIKEDIWNVVIVGPKIFIPIVIFVVFNLLTFIVLFWKLYWVHERKAPSQRLSDIILEVFLLLPISSLPWCTFHIFILLTPFDSDNDIMHILYILVWLSSLFIGIMCGLKRYDDWPSFFKEKVNDDDLNQSVKDNSFIVDLWSDIFKIFSWISPFKLVLFFLPKLRGETKYIGGYKFTDAWVLGHLLLSFILYVISIPSQLLLFKQIAVLYGSIRLFEIVVYQINILFFGSHRADKRGETYFIRGYPRLNILLLHNFFEIVLWFALFYNVYSSTYVFQNTMISPFLIYLKLSFVMMTTYGYVNITSLTNFGYILTQIQSLIGMFITILMISRFISYMPKPIQKKPDD